MGIERRWEGSDHIGKLKEDMATMSTTLSLALEILPEELLMHGVGGPEYQKIEHALENAFAVAPSMDAQDLQMIVGKTIETELASHPDVSAIAQAVVEKIKKEMKVKGE